ncbi:MAG: 16S rRNA (cytosine(1402)-N(4))-methyltransferase [Chitinophagales bacterium]
MFGKRKSWNWKLLNKKPIGPSEEEIKKNSRSRSAKLRVMERVG